MRGVRPGCGGVSTATGRAERRRGRVPPAVGVTVAGAFFEGVPQGVHRGCEVRELLEVLLAERFELPRALVGEAQAYDAEVVGVLAARDQPGASRRGRRGPTALWGRSMR